MITKWRRFFKQLYQQFFVIFIAYWKLNCCTIFIKNLSVLFHTCTRQFCFKMNKTKQNLLKTSTYELSQKVLTGRYRIPITRFQLFMSEVQSDFFLNRTYIKHCFFWYAVNMFGIISKLVMPLVSRQYTSCIMRLKIQFLSITKTLERHTIDTRKHLETKQSSHFVQNIAICARQPYTPTGQIWFTRKSRVITCT